MADIEKHNPTSPVSFELINDLRQIIDAARSHVAATANYELTAMYWHIGNRINNEVLGNERAEYGQQIVSAVSTQLQAEYGTKGFDEKSIRRMMHGFSPRNLKYMRLFAESWPNPEIMQHSVAQLPWRHNICLLEKVKEPNRRLAQGPGQEVVRL